MLESCTIHVGLHTDYSGHNAWFPVLFTVILGVCLEGNYLYIHLDFTVTCKNFRGLVKGFFISQS